MGSVVSPGDCKSLAKAWRFDSSLTQKRHINKGKSMTREDFEGKTFGEVIDGGTEMLHYVEKEKIEDLKIVHPRISSDGHVSVLFDRHDYFVVFVNEKPKAVFSMYEPRGVYVNGVRGLVMVYGHEDIHLYWIDIGQFVNVST